MPMVRSYLPGRGDNVYPDGAAYDPGTITRWWGKAARCLFALLSRWFDPMIQLMGFLATKIAELIMIVMSKIMGIIAKSFF